MCAFQAVWHFFHNAEFLNNDLLFTIFCLLWKKFNQAWKNFINTAVVCTFMCSLCKECQQSPTPAKMIYALTPYAACLLRKRKSRLVQATPFQWVPACCRESPRLQGQSSPFEPTQQTPTQTQLCCHYKGWRRWRHFQVHWNL